MQWSTRIPEKAELDGEAEAVGGAATDTDRGQVGLGESVMPGKLPCVHIGDGFETDALGR